MSDLIVGTPECPTRTVVNILRKDNNVRNNWQVLVSELGLKGEDIDKLKRNYEMFGVNSFGDVIRQVIEIWVSKCGTEARLSKLINILVECCEACSVGEKLTKEFQLDEKKADESEESDAHKSREDELKKREEEQQKIEEELKNREEEIKKEEEELKKKEEEHEKKEEERKKREDEHKKKEEEHKKREDEHKKREDELKKREKNKNKKCDKYEQQQDCDQQRSDKDAFPKYPESEKSQSCCGC